MFMFRTPIFSYIEHMNKGFFCRRSFFSNPWNSSLRYSSLSFLWQIGGIYPENFRVLKADPSRDYALSPDTLSEAVSHDMATGLIPFFFCATVREIGKEETMFILPNRIFQCISKRTIFWFYFLGLSHFG